MFNRDMFGLEQGHGTLQAQGGPNLGRFRVGGGHAGGGLFWDMAVSGMQACDVFKPDPCPDPPHQIGHCVVPIAQFAGGFNGVGVAFVLQV